MGDGELTNQHPAWEMLQEILLEILQEILQEMLQEILQEILQEMLQEILWEMLQEMVTSEIIKKCTVPQWTILSSLRLDKHNEISFSYCPHRNATCCSEKNGWSHLTQVTQNLGTQLWSVGYVLGLTILYSFGWMYSSYLRLLMITNIMNLKLSF